MRSLARLLAATAAVLLLMPVQGYAQTPAKVRFTLDRVVHTATHGKETDRCCH